MRFSIFKNIKKRKKKKKTGKKSKNQYFGFFFGKFEMYYLNPSKPKLWVKIRLLVKKLCENIVSKKN